MISCFRDVFGQANAALWISSIVVPQKYGEINNLLEPLPQNHNALFDSFVNYGESTRYGPAIRLSQRDKRMNKPAGSVNNTITT